MLHAQRSKLRELTKIGVIMKKILLGTMILMALSSSQIFAKENPWSEINVPLAKAQGISCTMDNGNGRLLNTPQITAFTMNHQIKLNVKITDSYHTGNPADIQFANDINVSFDNWANVQVTEVTETRGPGYNTISYTGKIQQDARGKMLKGHTTFTVIMDRLDAKQDVHYRSRILVDDETPDFPEWTEGLEWFCQFTPR